MTFYFFSVLLQLKRLVMDAREQFYTRMLGIIGEQQAKLDKLKGRLQAVKNTIEGPRRNRLSVQQEIFKEVFTMSVNSGLESIKIIQERITHKDSLLYQLPVTGNFLFYTFDPVDEQEKNIVDVSDNIANMLKHLNAKSICLVNCLSAII